MIVVMTCGGGVTHVICDQRCDELSTQQTHNKHNEPNTTKHKRKKHSTHTHIKYVMNTAKHDININIQSEHEHKSNIERNTTHKHIHGQLYNT